MINNRFFFKYLMGTWFKQENLFLLKDYKHNKSEGYINFSTNYRSVSLKRRTIDKNLSYSYFTFSEQNKYYGSLIKASLLEFNHRCYNKEILFHLRSSSKTYLKIKKLDFRRQFRQQEYIYAVNKNIMLSIVIVKDLRNQYLGVKVASYIRLKT